MVISGRLIVQPYFTATASNVLFYWSHDIGGHRSTSCNSTTEPTETCEFGHTDAAYDPELYLRWVQVSNSQCFAVGQLLLPELIAQQLLTVTN